jgi:hypothetical protein
MKKSAILSVFIGLIFAFIVYKLLYPSKVVSSGSSSANTGETPTIVTPPSIMSNPSTVIAGTSVTFSASNITGVCHWFKNGTYLSEGQFLTVANPTGTDIYTAKNFFNNIYSEASTGITVGSVPTITVTPPTIVANPTNVVAGTSVTLTATIANGINQWLKNGVYLQDGLTLTVANPTANDVYTSKCYYQNTYSVVSNSFTVQSVQAPPVANFTNRLKLVAKETVNGNYSPQSFPITAVSLKPYGTQQIAKYPIVWHSQVKENFGDKNRRVEQNGISSAMDHIPVFGGYMTRGTEWLYANDPNTGQPWTDPVANTTPPFFTSTVPFQFKASGEGSTPAGSNLYNEEQLYDLGNSMVRGSTLGFGDNVGNKVNRAFVTCDDELGLTGGMVQQLPALIGMADNMVGLVSMIYCGCINVVYPDRSHYPTDYQNGGYPANRINLDGSVTSTPNVVTTPMFAAGLTVNIPSRNIANKGINDFANLCESNEISSYASEAFRHGESFAYDNNDPNLIRVVNKFGANRNTDHPISKIIYAVEVRKWYLRKNFPNTKMFTLSKILCDRADLGITNYGKFGNYNDNTAHQAKHHDRRGSLGIVGFTAFCGSYLHVWDRNMSNNIDGYNGALGMIELLNQKKQISQGNLSFVDLFDSFDFKLWTSEISYDNGATWKQEKGVDYIMSQTSIPYRCAVSANGVWAVFLHRNENTELKACKLRMAYNSGYKYLDITADMWETTNPTLANTVLASIADTDKDYYFNLIDLTV